MRRRKSSEITECEVKIVLRRERLKIFLKQKSLFPLLYLPHEKNAKQRVNDNEKLVMSKISFCHFKGFFFEFFVDITKEITAINIPRMIVLCSNLLELRWWISREWCEGEVMFTKFINWRKLSVLPRQQVWIKFYSEYDNLGKFCLYLKFPIILVARKKF